MRHWLLKSEPSAYSIDDLARDRRTRWTGVRNYQARNFMIDMAVDDLVLLYHSNADPPGLAGLARITARAAADETQFDPEDSHFDPKATVAKPIWQCVEVGFVAKAKRFVPLEVCKVSGELAGMELLRKGSRLSVQPVAAAHFVVACRLAGLKA